MNMHSRKRRLIVIKHEESDTMNRSDDIATERRIAHDDD
jgi:hypothetical protein